MTTYLDGVKEEFKDGKKALLTIIFTIARLIYGWEWLSGGIEKLAWFSNGKMNSAGLIGTLVKNIDGPKTTRFDPLYLNKVWAWVAQHIFIGMPRVTDYLVVICEIGIGILMILGFRLFWVALIAMFLNVQFMAAGSFNNFGYIWTNLAVLKFAKHAEFLGVSGYLKYRKGSGAFQAKHQTV